MLIQEIPPTSGSPIMPTHSKPQESRLLYFSVWMGVLFAVGGISWGLVIQSGVILFDGIYSGLSIILSLLSVIALRLIRQADDDTFQFGRRAFEPMIVAFKSIVIIAICSYGIVSAIILISNGGAESTNSVMGMLYGAISMAACLFSWQYLKIHGTDMPDLVQAESEQWLMDTMFSMVVLASFALGYLLAKTPLEYLVPFLDPVTVLLGSLYFVRIPLGRFIYSMRELLMIAPTDAVQEEIQERVNAIAASHQFFEAIVRSSKIGRELAVDITFLARPEHERVDIAELDKIRTQVQQSLSGLGYTLWMNVLFTKDRYWA